MKLTYYKREPSQKIKQSSDRLKKICCDVLMIGINDAFFFKSRYRDAVVARQIYCYIIYEYLKDINSGLSLGDIGRMVYNNKDIYLDHATIIHSIKTVSNLISTDKIVRDQVETITFRFYKAISAIEQKKNMFSHHLIMLEKPKQRTINQNIMLK